MLQIKWPHKKFIQTLICGRLSADSILDHLQKWALPFPTDDLQDMYEEIREKHPAYFARTSHVIKAKILRTLKIEPIYAHYFKKGTTHDISHIPGIFKLLDNRQIRTFIFATVLAGISSDDIELILNGKFDINASSLEIDGFIDYFFNLQDFVHRDKVVLEEQFAKDIDTKRAFRLALKNDRNYMLWKLGAAPQKSFNGMLRDMMHDSYYLFKEKSKNNPEVATKFGSLAVKLADRLDRADQRENDADEFFNDMEFDIKENNSATIINPVSLEDIGAEVGGIPDETSAKLQAKIQAQKEPLNLDDLNDNLLN